jgi:hypothetical protein
LNVEPARNSLLAIVVLTVVFSGSFSYAATISGTISPTGSSAGTTIALSGAATATATVNSSGNYSFSGLAAGTYTVTPSQSGFSFNPPSQSVTLTRRQSVTVNFTAVAQGSGSGVLIVDGQTWGDSSTASSNISTPAFTTSAGNELLLALVATDGPSGSTNQVTNMSGAGLTWSLVRRTNAQPGTAEIWRAFTTTPLTNAVVTATLSNPAASSITLISFKGVDTTGSNGSGAVGATASGNATSGAPTASLVTTRNNSWVLGIGNDWDQAISRVVGSNQSIIHQYLAAAGDTYWVQGENAPTPLAGSTVTINDTAPTGDHYNLTLVEVLPATAGGGSGGGASTYTISGTISPTSSGAGTTVTLTGATSMAAIADSSGKYSFTGLPNGSYAITPSKSGFTFTPASLNATVNGANLTGENFSATATAPQTYSISGTISPATSGAGSLLTLSGSASATTMSDASGNYSFMGLSNGSYVVTASGQGVTYTPVSQPITIAGTNVSGINFTATSAAKVIFFDNFSGSSLSSAWTVISRHGEYSQDETECNIPQQVSVANGLTITTAAQTWTCGDYNPDGTVWHTPTSWPYVSGDIQWTSLNFTYGTVEVRAKYPDQRTSLWPSIWLLSSNCQKTNPFTGSTGVGTCPNGTTGYTEIDMTECYGSAWCDFHVANPSFGIGNGCDAYYAVDTNFHTFTTVWTSSGIKQYMDGVLETTCNQNLVQPMFLIIQTQTGGQGGTPNNSFLPANLVVDYVKVTQP